MELSLLIKTMLQLQQGEKVERLNLDSANNNYSFVEDKFLIQPLKLKHTITQQQFLLIPGAATGSGGEIRDEGAQQEEGQNLKLAWLDLMFQILRIT